MRNYTPLLIDDKNVRKGKVRISKINCMSQIFLGCLLLSPILLAESLPLHNDKLKMDKLNEKPIVKIIYGSFSASQNTDDKKFNALLNSQIVVDSKGDIFTNDYHSISDNISKITSTGIETVNTSFFNVDHVHAFAIDINDNIFMMERVDPYVDSMGEGGGMFNTGTTKYRGHSKLVKLTPSGKLTTVISKNSDLYRGIAIDHDNNVYVSTGEVVLKIQSKRFWFNKTQELISYTKNNSNVLNSKKESVESPLLAVMSMAIDRENNLYFIERVRFVNKPSFVFSYVLKKLTPDGEIIPIAGSRKLSGAIDGVRDSASFDSPQNLSIDENNNLYLLESRNNTIRRINPKGKVTTIIGQSETNNLIEGMPQGGLNNIISITVRHDSLYLVLKNGIAQIKNISSISQND